VGLDGAQLDDEVARHLGVGAAGRQQLEHVQLARRDVGLRRLTPLQTPGAPCTYHQHVMWVSMAAVRERFRTASDSVTRHRSRSQAGTRRRPRP
jgi:hypothetical protein